MQLQISVISLKTSKDRRAALSADLSFREGFTWSFFDALGPAAAVPSLACDAESQIRHYGRALTPGEIGCFKSHWTLLSTFARESRDDWLLVLEDDVWLDPDFALKEIVAYCEARDIAYIRLFAKAYKPARVLDTLSGFRQIIRFKTDPYGAQAYLISRKGAKALLKNLRAIDVPFDDVLGRFWEHGLDPYCVFPFPAVERSVASALTAHRDAGAAGRRHLTPARLVGRLSSKAKKTSHNARYALRRYI